MMRGLFLINFFEFPEISVRRTSFIKTTHTNITLIVSKFPLYFRYAAPFPYELTFLRILNYWLAMCLTHFPFGFFTAMLAIERMVRTFLCLTHFPFCFICSSPFTLMLLCKRIIAIFFMANPSQILNSVISFDSI